MTLVSCMIHILSIAGTGAILESPLVLEERVPKQLNRSQLLAWPLPLFLIERIVVMKVLCNPHVLYTRNVSSLIKGLLISVNDGIFSTDRFISRD